MPTSTFEALCREFCTYQSDVIPPAYDPDDRVGVFWVAIQKVTDPATNQPTYLSFCRLAKLVPLIHHNNAYRESVFSMVKKMTTDQRSTLGRGKEGHVTSSMYEDTHGVRNTLCGLLAGKINIFKKGRHAPGLPKGFTKGWQSIIRYGFSSISFPPR
ncbi:hypothetical protein ScPMuIL_008080 [Solemya velum]